ncbi:hypothetical protein [Maricaulis sp.]|uniref:hypothetical protein n=1 Tax=Maricaulis sp. TaxID=1486257 RepID=UPI0026048340|nr:hypothetical protein [Maricaulis sp.]
MTVSTRNPIVSRLQANAKAGQRIKLVLVGVFWLVLMLVNWPQWLFGTAFGALLPTTWTSLVALELGPVALVTLALNAVFVFLVVRWVRPSTTNAADMLDNPVLLSLKKRGIDPEVALNEFQQAYDDGRFVETEELIATPSWAFMTPPANAKIVRMTDCAWLYFRASGAELLAKAGAMSGALTARQADLVAKSAKDADTVVIRTTTTRNSLNEIACSPKDVSRLVKFFTSHNPGIVVGWTKEREALWNESPKAFVEAEPSHATSAADTRTSRDAMEVAENLTDKLSLD